MSTVNIHYILFSGEWVFAAGATFLFVLRCNSFSCILKHPLSCKNGVEFSRASSYGWEWSLLARAHICNEASPALTASGELSFARCFGFNVIPHGAFPHYHFETLSKRNGQELCSQDTWLASVIYLLVLILNPLSRVISEKLEEVRHFLRV